MAKLLSRGDFDQKARERDSDTCVVPWCRTSADEVHHIIERSCWENGGYYLRNAASVCNPHHRAAESDLIPPQAFWYWLDIEPLIPSFEHNSEWNVDKWGEPFPTRELDFNVPVLPNSPSEQSDKQLTQVSQFIDVPIILIGIPTGEFGVAFGGQERLETSAPSEVEAPDLTNMKESVRVVGDVGGQKFTPLAAHDTEYNLWLSVDAVACETQFDSFTPTNETEVYAIHEKAASVFDSSGYSDVLVRVRYPAHNGQFPERFALYRQP